MLGSKIRSKRMENTIMGYIGYISGLYRGLYRDNGQENGNYYSRLGYVGVIWGLYGGSDL